MTTLQDIMGLIIKRKIKTPTDNDYIISAAYTDIYERLKPQPKMEPNLLSLGAIKKYLLASITPPKYKVFTALLTQSGEDNHNDSDNFQLEIGVTYTIIEFGSYTLGDFTNVGAPNNEIGTSFIATNTTPNSWGTNIGLSWNGGAPVATVVENTIGNIWFSYQGIGSYNANLVGAFDDQKTFVTITNPNSAYTSTPGVCNTAVNIDYIQLNTFNDTFTTSNNQLYLNAFEIRVYN